MQSQAQRAYLHIHHPEIAQEFEAATPKGKKLPKHVKKTSALTNAYEAGYDTALNHFGLKQAAEEIRRQFSPRNKFHGYAGAWREAAKKGEGTKKADEETKDNPLINKLTEALQQIDKTTSPAATEATKDPLDRTTMWGGATNPDAGDTASRDPSLNIGLGGSGKVF